MKKTLLSLLACVLTAITLVAGRVSERVYISTDKDTYLAGETIWFSAFCVDPSKGVLSDASSVAYLEISSTEGVLLTGKIALIGGRGSGALQLPATTPTGNYTVLAYTAPSKGRTDLMADAKTVSVFNTFSSSRVKGGVEIVDSESVGKETVTGGKTFGNVNIIANPAATPSSVSVVGVRNDMPSKVTLSLSVSLDDNLPAPSEADLRSFLATPNSGFKGEDSDKEGETFRGKLIGQDADKVFKEGLIAVVAFPGHAQDVYAGRVAADGTVSFVTDNVHGNRDMVCEILGQDESADCRLVIDQPYLNVKPENIPSLRLSKSFERALLNRHTLLRSSFAAEPDTLLEFLPKRSGLFLSDEHCKRYHLDDYNRFPTIRETLIEITPGLRIRKGMNGKTEIQTRLEDVMKDNTEYSGNMLVLIDGVPVKDVDRLLEFDTYLLSDILVYPYSYSFGEAIFSGVVDFVTKKGDISSFKFDKNVLIVDWQGTCYPVALTCAGMAASKDDTRSTLYWHPTLELAPGEKLDIEVKTPSYQGVFKIVAEGISADGTPFRSESRLEVAN